MINTPDSPFLPHEWQSCVLICSVLATVFALAKFSGAAWRGTHGRLWARILLVCASPFILAWLFTPHHALDMIYSIAWTMLQCLLYLGIGVLEILAVRRFRAHLHPILVRAVQGCASLAICIHMTTLLIWVRHVVLGSEHAMAHPVLAFVKGIEELLWLINGVVWLGIVYWFARAPISVLFPTPKPAPAGQEEVRS